MAVSALLLVLSAAAPTTALPDATPVSAERLGEMRGGFDLPGGGSVTMGVVTSTRVDGQEVLRTIFTVQAGAPRTEVLARTADGLVPVASGTTTLDGRVTAATLPNGMRVELAGDRLDVGHLVGDALGAVVVNSADNRAIDTATTVDISMSGVARDAIGSVRPGIDTLALDATARLIR